MKTIKTPIRKPKKSEQQQVESFLKEATQRFTTEEDLSKELRKQFADVDTLRLRCVQFTGGLGPATLVMNNDGTLITSHKVLADNLAHFIMPHLKDSTGVKWTKRLLGLTMLTSVTGLLSNNGFFTSGIFSKMFGAWHIDMDKFTDPKSTEFEDYRKPTNSFLFKLDEPNTFIQAVEKMRLFIRDQNPYTKFKHRTFGDKAYETKIKSLYNIHYNNTLRHANTVLDSLAKTSESSGRFYDLAKRLVLSKDQDEADRIWKTKSSDWYLGTKQERYELEQWYKFKFADDSHTGGGRHKIPSQASSYRFPKSKTTENSWLDTFTDYTASFARSIKDGFKYYGGENSQNLVGALAAASLGYYLLHKSSVSTLRKQANQIVKQEKHIQDTLKWLDQSDHHLSTICHSENKKSIVEFRHELNNTARQRKWDFIRVRKALKVLHILRPNGTPRDSIRDICNSLVIY